MEQVRIDKYLAVALGVSRNDAKSLLRNGKISVNGETVRRSDYKLDVTAEVRCSNELLTYKKHIYILMNKPEGILSASTDKRVKTVVDIVPEKLRRAGLFPVGRLDKNTTGLLIITDDGDFGHRVTSPKSRIEKCYRAELDGEILHEHIELFAKGVTLADGESCMPADLSRESERVALVKLREGKYHQIKRMFGVVGLGVNRLERLSIGDLTLPDGLKRGESRELSDEEIKKIFV